MYNVKVPLIIMHTNNLRKLESETSTSIYIKLEILMTSLVHNS